MTTEITLQAVCAPSDDVVARVIEGEIIIVPLGAALSDTDNELFTLNEVGKAVWDRLDGKRSLADVAAELAGEFDAPAAKIQADVLGFAAKMTQLGILAAEA